MYSLSANPTSQPGCMQHGDNGHAVADFAVKDHLQHLLKGKHSHFQKFGLIGHGLNPGQPAAKVQMTDFQVQTIKFMI